MKALSVQQPWAWCIVNGYKPVENRDWPTKMRGTISIHAGKTYDAAGERWIRTNCPDVPLPPRSELEKQMGGIVGEANVTGCVEDHPSRWFQGRFAFCLADAKQCALVPLRGRLGFFEVPTHD